MLFFIPLLGSLLLVSPVYAEETGTQRVSAVVEPRTTLIEVADSNMSFSNLKKEFKKVSYIHPEITLNIFLEDDDRVTQTHLAENPYSSVKKGESSTTGGSAKVGMIRITNDDIDHPDFKVTVSRSKFVHNETGEEMSNVKLFMGEFKDGNDYTGKNRNKELSNNYMNENNYWLAYDLTIEEDSPSLVADYRGTAALGKHWLSPYTSAKISNDGSFGTATAERLDRYTEKNISLAIDDSSVIPKSGGYTTTLTWAIEKTP